MSEKKDLQIPDNIIEPAIILKDKYFDLRGASGYSSMAVSTIRSYIKAGSLPAYKVGGKVLIRRSELDSWIETFRINKKQELNSLVDGVIEGLKSR